MNELETKLAILKMKSSSLYRELMSYYQEDNLFFMTNVARWENVHSDFLAWVFSSSSRHGLGEYATEYLLGLLDYAKMKEYNNLAEWPTFLDNYSVAKKYKVVAVDIDREHIEDQVSKRRMDLLFKITLQNKSNDEIRLLYVVLENKVKSREYNDQTMAYYNNVVHSYSNKNTSFVYVYLTPLSTDRLNCLHEQECKSKAYIQINYQEILNYVLEPCLRNPNLDDKAKWYFEQYIRCLGTAKNIGECDDGKDELVMAMDDGVRKMLNQLYFDNLDLFNNMAAAITPQNEQDEANISALKGQKRKINAIFVFDDERYVQCSAVIKAFVKKFLADNAERPNAIQILADKFRGVSSPKGGGNKEFILDVTNPVIIQDRQSDKNIYFPKAYDFDFNGKKYTVDNQWTLDRIENNVIPRAKELGYEISVSKEDIVVESEMG